MLFLVATAHVSRDRCGLAVGHAPPLVIHPPNLINFLGIRYFEVRRTSLRPSGHLRVLDLLLLHCRVSKLRLILLLLHRPWLGHLVLWIFRHLHSVLL